MPGQARFFQAAQNLDLAPDNLMHEQRQENEARIAARLRQTSLSFSAVFIGLKYVAMCIEFTVLTGSIALGIGIATAILATFAGVAWGMLKWLAGSEEEQESVNTAPP